MWLQAQSLHTSMSFGPERTQSFNSHKYQRWLWLLSTDTGLKCCSLITGLNCERLKIKVPFFFNYLVHNRGESTLLEPLQSPLRGLLECILNAQMALKEPCLINSKCSWKIQRCRHFVINPFVGYSKPRLVSCSKLSFILGVSTNRVLQFNHEAKPIQLHRSSFYSWMENWLCWCSPVCSRTLFMLRVA